MKIVTSLRINKICAVWVLLLRIWDRGYLMNLLSRIWVQDIEITIPTSMSHRASIIGIPKCLYPIMIHYNLLNFLLKFLIKLIIAFLWSSISVWQSLCILLAFFIYSFLHVIILIIRTSIIGIIICIIDCWTALLMSISSKTCWRWGRLH